MEKSLWQIKNNENLNSPCPLESLPESLWKIFYSRGFKTKKQIEDFLEPCAKNLTSPFKMKGMEKSVDRLIKAFLDQEKVGIYGDFDMDGSSACFLVEKALTDLGFKDVCVRQPKRLSEGYGFHSTHLDFFKSEKVSVIITLDVGVTEHEVIEKAKKSGIDVILTDHHQPGKKLPKAYSVINPHQKGCPSKLIYLAGVGVGFYLMWALTEKMKEKDLIDKTHSIQDLLDVFTLGTLCDVVPLREDNRFLVKKGLKCLSQTNKPGVKALIENLNIKHPLSSEDVVLKIIPKLNSLTRLEENLQPIDVLKVSDPVEAKKVVERTLAYNEKRKAYQKEAEQMSFEFLKAKTVKDFVFVYSEKFHKGVLGIVASRLVDLYNVPCFVATQKGENSFVGSSRMPSDLDLSLVDMLEFCKKDLIRFGGHNKAAGFELSSKSLEDFESSLTSFFKKNKKIPSQKYTSYDLELSFDEITQTNFMKWYDLLEPFGMGFEAPTFLFRDLEVLSADQMRGGHLRFYLKQGKSSLRAVWFFPPQEHELVKNLVKKYEKVDVLAQIKKNHFNGKTDLQIQLRDIKKSV